MDEAVKPDSSIRLDFTGGALALFGRYLLTVLLSLLIVPAPWGYAWFHRWFVAKVSLSNGAGVSFHGRGEEIWLPVMAAFALYYAGYFTPFPYSLVFTLLEVLCSLLIVKWYVRSMLIGADTRFRFTGEYLPLLGWYILFTLSIFTIIGWAWVEAAIIRWYCENAVSANLRAQFIGSGWGILWRTIVAVFLCVLIIPIPWVLRWLTRWYVSNTIIREVAQ